MTSTSKALAAPRGVAKANATSISSEPRPRSHASTARRRRSMPATTAAAHMPLAQQPQGETSVDPSLIQATRWADRHPETYSQKDYLDLKADIAAKGGNIVPIKLRLRGRQGKKAPRYEIVYEHRRHRACLELGLPVRAVVAVLSDEELVQQLHAENSHRKNLSAIERGTSYCRMLEHALFANQRAIALKLKVSAGDVSRLVFLARLPVEVLAILEPLELAIHDADKLRPALADRRAEVMGRAAQIAANEGTWPTREAVRRLTGSQLAPTVLSSTEVRPLVVKGQHCGQLAIDAAGCVSMSLSIALSKRQIDVLQVAVRRLLKNQIRGSYDK